MATRALGTCTFGTSITCPVSTLPTTQCLTFSTSGFPNVTGDASYRNNVATLGGRIKVSDPTGTIVGTAVFISGGGGEGFWETSLSNVLANVLTPLLTANWRLVQVSWDDPVAGPGAGPFAGSQGPLALMVRAATLLRGIYDNAGIRAAGKPFVVCGQSGGSSQVGYSLAQYGMGDTSIGYVDMAIMCSGPPHGRIDYGAMGALDPTWSAGAAPYKSNAGGLIGYVPGASALFLDWSYGADNAGAGFSATAAHALCGGPSNMAFQDSVANGLASYAYPKTDIRCLYGDGDSSEAPPLGRIYTKGSGRIGGSALAGKTYSESITTGNIQHVNVPGSTSGSAYIVASIEAATFNH